MLHGELLCGLGALVLTLFLCPLWIGAMAIALIDRKELRWRTASAMVLLPPIAWIGTIQMVNLYPYWIHRLYFQNHIREYEEAVRLAGTHGNPGTFTLPDTMRRLSLDGTVQVVGEAPEQRRYVFSVSHVLLMGGPVIEFDPHVEAPSDSETLAKGWSLVAIAPD